MSGPLRLGTSKTFIVCVVELDYGGGRAIVRWPLEFGEDGGDSHSSRRVGQGLGQPKTYLMGDRVELPCWKLAECSDFDLYSTE